MLFRYVRTSPIQLSPLVMSALTICALVSQVSPLRVCLSHTQHAFCQGETLCRGLSDRSISHMVFFSAILSKETN